MELNTDMNVEVLLVEDSLEDVELTRMAIESHTPHFHLHVVNDGMEALKFLRKINGYKTMPTPDIVLLDLNLPRKDGREVLAEIKMDNELKKIPVIVLTTSNSEADILACYNNYANCYVTKPVDLESFMEMAKIIEQFWFRVVCLPKKHDQSA
ncbi:MAG: response regulator [Flavobacteriales bacterium]|nr:response regulator [Flavobacteriales bacterium]